MIHSTPIATLSKDALSDLRSPIMSRLRPGASASGLRVVMLVILDSILLLTAWTIVKGSLSAISSLTLSLILSISLLAVSGLYGSGGARRDYLSLFTTLTLVQIVHLCYVQTLSLSLVSFNLWASWLLGIVLVCTGRLSVDLLVNALRGQGEARYPVFLIGTSADMAQTAKKLEQEGRYVLQGQADILYADRDRWSSTLEKIRNLGVTEVFVSNWSAIKDPLFLYWNLQTSGISLTILPIGPIGFEVPHQHSQMRMVAGLPALCFRPPLITGTNFWIKRCFDFFIASLLLLSISPLLIAIALCIKFSSAGPIFFKQTRIGLHGKPFQVWKFRTMVNNAEQLLKELEAQNKSKDGVLFKLKKDPRVTKVGHFLRQYSLDELPQLFNVLFGQMSLVGPRPFATRDVEKLSAHHADRHIVLPGITGLWQVSGRSDSMDIDHVVRLDVSYIKNWSLWLDFKILLRTVLVVLRKEGAY
jgi:exopolysaccharide biosynthesis polyprenyl glycosylphosphotransferase